MKRTLSELQEESGKELQQNCDCRICQRQKRKRDEEEEGEGFRQRKMRKVEGHTQR